MEMKVIPVEAGPGVEIVSKAWSAGSSANTVGITAMAARREAELFPRPVITDEKTTFYLRRAYAEYVRINPAPAPVDHADCDNPAIQMR